MGQIGVGSRDAVRVLVKTLDNKDVRMVLWAVHTLGQVGPEAKSAVRSLLVTSNRRDLHDIAIDALAKIGKAAVPELADALTNPSASIRLAAAEALAKIGPDAKNAVSALVLIRKDPVPEVRQAVQRALFLIQGKE